ncbi:MAG: BrxA/BrxB family bacilliredoxin [Calditrichaeota bacterium]|nr:MAG: BrxA/BrxB family bacilliredoxin [Calditrichota bacterium]
MFQMQSLYPEEMVAPMRQELTTLGFEELRTEEDVDKALSEQKGTALLVVNSVCGCAAGSARPAVNLAVAHETRPDRLLTVFAGVDRAATEKARSYILGYPPSSPSMALFKDGQLVHFIPRMGIEGYTPEQIAQNLIEAFETHCK